MWNGILFVLYRFSRPVQQLILLIEINYKYRKPNTMKKENKTWITEREAAKIIQLPGKFVRKLVTGGSLKGVVNYFKSKRADYRYNKIELENYLFENSFLAGL